MRKILGFVLLVVLGLPSALPLLAAGQGEAGVPVCCRRLGKHHCMMVDAPRSERAEAKQGLRGMRAAGEVCSYRCGLPAGTHVETSYAGAASRWMYAALMAHPAVHAQTESRWRVARERSRGKRGPPAVQPGC